MRSLRMAVICLIYYLRYLFRHPRTYVAFALLACFSVASIDRYVAYANSIGEPINAFEPFVLLLGDKMPGFVSFIAVFIMLSDAPFMRPGQAYTMLRLGRRRYWFAGQLLYIFSASIIAMGFLCAINFLLYGRMGYIGDVWSQAYAGIASGAAQGPFTFMASARLMTAMPPSMAMLHTLLLGMLYCALAALVMYLVNLRNRKVIGFGCAIILHTLGKLGDYIGRPAFNRWIPYHNAILGEHSFIPGGGSFTLAHSYLYFIVLISILLTIISIRLRKQDMEVGDLSGI